MRKIIALTNALVLGAALLCHPQYSYSRPRCTRVANDEFARPGSLLNATSVKKAILRAYLLSGSGTLHVEFGFGVIRSQDGSFEATVVTRGEAGVWKANLPASTIAIFHTHWNGVSPWPSPQDMQEADRLQIPIYVISRRDLCVYEPTVGSNQHPASKAVEREGNK
ncbi:MAG TPA: hypothetical protein VKN18_10755 [Blastocatellia bacterium]|nr:hypothetical protein [Blastocatellia bacterium]